MSGSSAMPQIGQEPGPCLPDLRMHRAGIDRALRHRLGLALFRREIFLRIGGEFRPAPGAAEIIGVAFVIVAVLGAMRIDGHAADWIAHAFGLRMAVSVVIVMRVRHAVLPVLALHTPRGYIGFMQKQAKASVEKRLQRIEGQVRGFARMVADDRYCIDIVTQISAVRAALRRAEEEILRDHVAHCVEGAIASGNRADQRRKVAELMDVFGRAER